MYGSDHPYQTACSSLSMFLQMISWEGQQKNPSTSGKQEKRVAITFLITTHGGRRWIRTTEAGSNRFTVCPLWPLGNPPIFDWSWWTDSNPRPADYKSAALPAELHQHRLSNQRLHSIADEFSFVKWKFQILLSSIDWEILVLWRHFRYNNTRPAKQGKIP